MVKTDTTFECELALTAAAVGEMLQTDPTKLGAATPAAAVGEWLLETDAPARIYYDIVVSARHALTVEANVVAANRNGQPTGE